MKIENLEESRKLVKEIIERVENCGVEGLNVITIELKEKYCIKSNANVGKKDMNELEIIEWYLGQIININYEKAYYAVNSWINKGYDLFKIKTEVLQMFNFGVALEELKNGKKVARNGWNGKGMWLDLQTVDENSKMGHSYIYMSGADGKLFPWNPNNLDMLAEDWVLL